MDRIPEPLKNRMSELHAQQAVEAARERERLDQEAIDRILDEEANIEALDLGQQYAALLEEAGIDRVNIYGNFPKIRVSWLSKLGASYSFAGGSTKPKSDSAIDSMLEPTGEGWILGYGTVRGCDYDYEWSYAIDRSGHILSEFKDVISAGNLLKQRELGLGVGIYHPKILYGREALAAANNNKLLDGIATILDGRQVERRDYSES